MGGFSWARIDGHEVRYGDFVEVEFSDFGNVRKALCTFFEVTDDGDQVFYFVNEQDSVRGEDFISTHWIEFYSVRFVCHAKDPMLEIGAGI